jgi:hypothetical protein
VDQEGLSHEVEQRHAGIERGKRILEDHLHLAAQGPQLLPAQLADLDHRAVGDPHEDLPAGRLDRAHDAPGGRGLAAAALAHEAQRLPLVDVEVDAVHGANVTHGPPQEALPDRKELLQAGDPQQDFRGEGDHG